MPFRLPLSICCVHGEEETDAKPQAEQQDTIHGTFMPFLVLLVCLVICVIIFVVLSLRASAGTRYSWLIRCFVEKKMQSPCHYERTIAQTRAEPHNAD